MNTQTSQHHAVNPHADGVLTGGKRNFKITHHPPQKKTKTTDVLCTAVTYVSLLGAIDWKRWLNLIQNVVQQVSPVPVPGAIG